MFWFDELTTRFVFLIPFALSSFEVQAGLVSVDRDRINAISRIMEEVCYETDW
jgi:hypothetical protein